MGTNPADFQKLYLLRGKPLSDKGNLLTRMREEVNKEI